MRLLLIGDQNEETGKWKTTFHLMFPIAEIVESDIDAALALLRTEEVKWDIVIYLCKLRNQELMEYCLLNQLPILYIVDEKTEVDLFSYFKSQVGGIIRKESSMEMLWASVHMLLGKKPFIDPSLVTKAKIIGK